MNLYHKLNRLKEVQRKRGACKTKSKKKKKLVENSWKKKTAKKGKKINKWIKMRKHRKTKANKNNKIRNRQNRMERALFQIKRTIPRNPKETTNPRPIKPNELMILAVINSHYNLAH